MPILRRKIGDVQRELVGRTGGLFFFAVASAKEIVRRAVEDLAEAHDEAAIHAVFLKLPF